METKKGNSNIIIADDDLDDHYIIREVIEKINNEHVVTSVYNGLELIELLAGTGKYEEKLTPQLILMDLNMPLLDGLGALSQIKSFPHLKDVPIYILSNSRFEYDKQRAKELGANDFFTKPYKFEELKDIIKEIYTRTFAFTS